MCCFRAVIEGLWLRFQGEQVEVCVRRERRRRILQTLVWFIITLVLALFIPDIGRVISLIGGLAACFIFVFPGTLHAICCVRVFCAAFIDVKPTQCFFKFTGLCLMQAKLSETDVRSARWGSAVNLLSSGLLSASVYIFSFFLFFNHAVVILHDTLFLSADYTFKTSKGPLHVRLSLSLWAYLHTF